MIISYQIHRQINWEAFKTYQKINLELMNFKIKDATDLVVAADLVRGAVTSTYNGHCPMMSEIRLAGMSW